MFIRQYLANGYGVINVVKQEDGMFYLMDDDGFKVVNMYYSSDPTDKQIEEAIAGL